MRLVLLLVILSGCAGDGGSIASDQSTMHVHMNGVYSAFGGVVNTH